MFFHVFNRAARRCRIFEEANDYRAFMAVTGQAQRRSAVRILAVCVMPNHFHLVASPGVDGALSDFMHWMTMTHSKRWHIAHGSAGTGHLYQGRFKAFPVQNDAHFLAVCRYVERNALRAKLVSRAEEWPWTSASPSSIRASAVVLADWPIPRPAAWLDILNAPDPNTQTIRRALIKSRPFGSPDWAERTARSLSLENSLSEPGRPSR